MLEARFHRMNSSPAAGLPLSGPFITTADFARTIELPAPNAGSPRRYGSTAAPTVRRASVMRRKIVLAAESDTHDVRVRGMTMRFSPCGYLTTILGSPAPADPVVPRPVGGKRRALPPRSNVARISIHYGYGAKRARRGPSRTQIGLRRRSSRSLLAGRNSAGKEFGEARDWAGVFGDTRRFRVTETAPSRIPGGKAAESQRLFRRRRETAMAQDCVVAEAVLIGPVSVFFSLLTGKRTGNFVKIDPQA
jgi:hypothetical protein